MPPTALCLIPQLCVAQARAADGVLHLILVFGIRNMRRRCFHAEELKDLTFQCELTDDPVVAADGHTYNRFDIQN